MKYLKHPWIFLLISVAITLVIKINHLGFPFFLDETFSYYPAILEMSKVGPGILPGTIHMNLCMGHPLFFYFLASSWVKFVAGDSVTLTRIFPLIVSLLSLWVFHRFARRHVHPVTANVAVVLLALQPLFMGQSTLLLPEIFLSMLFILSFDFYLSGNYWMYALVGSLMMLTKETALVFVAVFGTTYLAENYRILKTTRFWKEITLMAVPVIVYGIFLILHKMKFGVFFFPEHLGYITLDPAKVRFKFSSSVSALFLAHAKNFVVFTALIALPVLYFRKRKIENSRFLLISLAIILVYLVFTILNFYTYRYVFPVMGIALLASLALIRQIRSKYEAINILYVAIAITASGYYLATKRGQVDYDLGYTEYLVVQQQMIKYCEQQDWYDKDIGASFNMVMSMRDRCAHYLSTDRNFPKMHHLPGTENRDILIYDSTCYPNEIIPEEKNKLILIKRFEYKHHWGEIYQGPASAVSDTLAQKVPEKL